MQLYLSTESFIFRRRQCSEEKRLSVVKSSNKKRIQLVKNFVSAFYLSCVQLPVKRDKAYQMVGALFSALYIFFSVITSRSSVLSRSDMQDLGRKML